MIITITWANYLFKTQTLQFAMSVLFSYFQKAREIRKKNVAFKELKACL
jgi:hypothetical protein